MFICFHFPFSYLLGPPIPIMDTLQEHVCVRTATKKKLKCFKRKKNLVISSCCISESYEDQYKHSTTPCVYKVAGTEQLRRLCSSHFKMGKIKQYTEEETGTISIKFRPAGGEVEWKRKSAHEEASNITLH